MHPHPLRFALLTLLCIQAQALAQDAGSPTPRIWRAPDGARFLLVPDRSPAAVPVVHWVVAIPTPLDDDPAGALGLSRAVVRASLDGTWRHGSTDPDAESRALDALDAVRAEVWAAAGSDGEGRVADELAARFDAASRAARALGDRSAWRRALANGPAAGPELLEVQGGSLVRVAAPTAALPHVAVLLRDWRENAVLRGFHDEQATVRDEFAALTAAPSGRLLKEVLGTTYLGAAAARYVEGRGSFVPLRDARRQWQRLAHPSRTLHVLTGGFDPGEVQSLLTAVFATTGLPPTSSPPTLAPAPGGGRRAVVPSDGATGVALAWPIPASATTFEIQVLGDWLAGNRNAFLTRHLSRSGAVDVRLSAPFPANATIPLFVVQVEDPTGARASDELEHTVVRRIAAIATDLDEKSLGWSVERVRARWTTRTADPGDVATELARDCGVVGRPPDVTLGQPPALDSRRLLRLAEEMFGDGPRTVVALSASR